jgi:hypothetical protein
MPYPSSSSGWHLLTAIPPHQESGTSSQTAQGKRRRRSSWDDDGDNSQEYGREGRGRGTHRPPARRQRMTTEQETVSAYVSSLYPPLTSLRTGIHRLAARFQHQIEFHRREVSQPRGTLIIRVILSIGEEREAQTPPPESRAGTITNQCLRGT